MRVRRSPGYQASPCRDEGSQRGELAKSRWELVKGRGELAKSRGELAKSRWELVKGRGELAKSRWELAKSRWELAKSRGELAKGRGELAKGRGELAKARGELAKARGDSACFWDAGATHPRFRADKRGGRAAGLREEGTQRRSPSRPCSGAAFWDPIGASGMHPTSHDDRRWPRWAVRSLRAAKPRCMA